MGNLGVGWVSHLSKSNFLFIKMWLHFILCYIKKSWYDGKDYASQCEGERFKYVLLHFIYFYLG